MALYKECKLLLKEYAIEAKKRFRDDKPAVRMFINDALDIIYRNEGRELSEHKKRLLDLYACKLHPKN